MSNKMTKPEMVNSVVRLINNEIEKITALCMDRNIEVLRANQEIDLINARRKYEDELNPSFGPSTDNMDYYDKQLKSAMKRHSEAQDMLDRCKQVRDYIIETFLNKIPNQDVKLNPF